MVEKASSKGLVPIFLSVGRTTTEAQEAFVNHFEALLREEGFEPCTVGRTQFTNKNPLDLVVAKLRECAGTIILAFERTHIAVGSEGDKLKAGKQQPPLPIEGRRLTTPWNHIEAAMAFMLGKPMLVVCERGVHQDGMLDRAGGYMVQTVELSDGVFSEKEFRNIFRAWLKEVTEGKARKLPGPPGTWTVGETLSALTWGQLAGVVATAVAILGATVKTTLYLGGQPPPSPGLSAEQGQLCREALSSLKSGGADRRSAEAMHALAGSVYERCFIVASSVEKTK